MNILVVDDIKVVGESIVKLLNGLYPKVIFQHYDVEISLDDNIKSISKIIIDNKINFLALDRNYSKILDSDDDYIYSCQTVKSKYKRKTADSLLCSKKGLLEGLTDNDLFHILVYTYDPYNSEIDKILIKLKSKILKIENLKKTNVLVIETSSVFNKPQYSDLYTGSFIANPTEISSFINKNRRKIGLKKSFEEYGNLISSIIKDIIKQDNSNLYSFTYRNNLVLDRHVRLLNRWVSKIDGKYELTIGSIAFLANMSGSETYLIDIPYKEYYENLNISIEKNGLLSLFKDSNGYYNRRAMFYSYNYNLNQNNFELYQFFCQKDIDKSIAIKWLPYLHSGIYHDSMAWSGSVKEEKIIINKKRINIFFFFQKVEIDDFIGHINYTLYNESNNEIDKKAFRKICDETYSIKYPLIRAKATDVLIPELKKLVQKQAIRAAISQVMARNMSHNIGSHVMNKMIGDVRKLELLDFEDDKTSYKSTHLKVLHANLIETLDKDDWYKKINIVIEEYDSINSKAKEFKNLALKNEIALKLISDFNSYVKCRMDYLADLTFGTPAMLSSKNVYTDIFEDLDKVRLLLDNISGRGQHFKYKILFKYKDIPINKETDFPVAIPNDVLGCQAFYNIIENVIRNTAKHATNNTISTKEFTINFRDIDASELDVVNVDLYHDAQTHYCVEIYDNIPITVIDEKVRSQNKKIQDPVLDKENKLRSESLGMIEMDASAAYLRQLEIVEVDSDDYDVDEDDKIYNSKGKLNILKAFNKEGCLAYRFFIKMPQEVLIVTENNFDNKKLIKEGIWVTDAESFKQHLEQNKNYNHNFLVIEENNDSLKNLIAENEAALTKRIFYKNFDEIKELLQKTPEEIKLELWRFKENELYDTYSSLGKRSNRTCEIIGLPKLNNKVAEFANHLYEIADSNNPLNIWNDKCQDHFYYEGLSSKAQSVLPAFNNLVKDTQSESEKIPQFLTALNDPNNNFLPRLHIAESILSRIIVLDERIQDKLNDELYKISFAEHFKMSGIFVPSKKVDLKADTIDIQLIINFVDKTMKENNYGIPMYRKMDFLLIHYSLLERAYENEKEKNNPRKLSKIDWVNNMLIEFSGKLNIVVTSGRGNIQGLPNNVRFVNLSVVTTALIEIKSKYLIHNILHSSRTT